MTIGNPPDSIDDKIQANIVAAGYGSATTAIAGDEATSRPGISLSYESRSATVNVGYTLDRSAQVRIRVLDLRGRVVAVLADGMVSAGRHDAVWNTAKRYSGLFAVAMEIEGETMRSGNVIVGR
jgi:hypothetical protein